MSEQQKLLEMMKAEFDRWEALLGGLSEAQILAPYLPAHLSIKDVMGHLRAWQSRSIARVEGAQRDREPEFPPWPAELHPDSEDNLDAVNAWIYETYRDQPWSSVHRDWRNGFLCLMELGASIPEADMIAPNRYTWMHGQPLALVYQSSYEHHHDEHYGPLSAWLRDHGMPADAPPLSR